MYYDVVLTIVQYLTAASMKQYTPESQCSRLYLHTACCLHTWCNH